MAIRGKLSEASLADVLQLLAMGRKTGCLSIARDSSFGEIHFESGRVVHAFIVNRRERLGDRLVRAGIVAPDTLTRLIAEEKPRDDRVLASLITGKGIAEVSDVEPHQRILVEEVVYKLFSWSHGTFTFETFASGEVPASLLSIAVDALLLEGARRIDEWSVIEKKITGMDLIFEADRTKADALESTDATEQRILPLLDGTADLNEVVERTGLSEFDVGKVVFGLVTAGVVQRVGRSAARHAPPPESRVAEHRNLGVAFYKTGMLSEAEREFNRVLELREGDSAARFHLGLVQLRRQDWRRAEATLREAAAEPDARSGIFLNLAFALECTGNCDEAAAMLDEAERRAVSPEPRISLSRAVLALRHRDPAAAASHLRKAREEWGDRCPDAAWYHYAGLAAALSGNLDGAVATLEEGLSVHPHSAVLHNNLAVALERRGNFELSARTLEHALLEDSNVPQLHKNLGDYYYRAQRFDEALDSYLRTVRLDAQHGSDVYLRIGNIHYRKGDRTAAADAWKRALAMDPSNEIVRGNLETIGERADSGTEPAAYAGTGSITTGSNRLWQYLTEPVG